MQYIVKHNTANRGPYFANRLPLLRQSCVKSLFAESQLWALQHTQPACKFYLCGAIFDLHRQPFTLAAVGSIYEKTYMA
jgi:hypothetical protein